MRAAFTVIDRPLVGNGLRLLEIGKQVRIQRVGSIRPVVRAR
jgi:hypothetical protein